MGRTFVAFKNGKRFCCTGNSSNCFKASLEEPLPEQPPAPELERATAEINRVLRETAEVNQDPSRSLVIVALPDADGEYHLRLTYVDNSECECFD
jgi:hypothetical protein